SICVRKLNHWKNGEFSKCHSRLACIQKPCRLAKPGVRPSASQKPRSASRAATRPPRKRQHGGVHRAGAGAADRDNLEARLLEQAIEHAPCEPPPCSASAICWRPAGVVLPRDGLDFVSPSERDDVL